MRKESTTKVMRRGFISTLALSAMLLTSCSSDSGIIDGGGTSTSNRELTALAHDKEVENVGTRSSLTYNSGTNTTTFKWDSSDKLTVFAEDNYQAKQIYNINYKEEYDNRAHFSSSDFKLTKDKRYFALSKTEGDNAGGTSTSIPDQKNIIIDYSGQTQNGNANPSHLGKYDFMATSAVCEEEDQLHFDFQHLGATFRMIIISGTGDNDFQNVKFSELELYSSDNSFRQPLRTFDLSKGVQSDGTFKPALEAPELVDGAKRFTVTLKSGSNAYIKPSDDFNDGSGTNTYKDLVVYIEVPPVDLSTKTIGLILRGKDEDDADVTYYSTHSGLNIQAGKVYNAYFVATKTTDYTVALKVNHLWQNGNTVDFTRATGDPGYDKENVLPKYVYLFFCADGKVIKVQPYTTSGNEGTDPNDWTRDGNISTYNTNTTINTFPWTVANDNSLRVYAIASPTEISHGITKATSSTDATNSCQESTVKALAYNYSSQENMRDLYSTPWENDATFIGNLKDPMQDIFVYHVAAKVDLKWNNTTATALTGNVSINSFQSENLSIFMPTQNGTPQATNGVADFTSVNKQSVHTSITTGTCWNGRQVYYLPQFADNTYNVTIGTGNTKNDVFNGTTTTGGFTSWYRALIIK